MMVCVQKCSSVPHAPLIAFYVSFRIVSTPLPRIPMSDRFEPLQPAALAFDRDGVPVSRHYGDVYHARAGALAQARHVFLAGNRLPQRWQGRAHFTVCETGFGTGNNFLALWQTWRADPRRCARLHMVSFEAHPFTAADMMRLAQRCDPALRNVARQLAAAWPVLTPGVHRLEFEHGAVTLTLCLGTIARMARQADAYVDAFFLDGFAPKHNPDMWTPALFGQLRRLAAHNATLATWCSAVAVRKALGDAGFLVTRAPGFAGKREMTVATLRPHLGRTPSSAPTAHVAVVGAGFAGAAIVHALTQRGHACTLLDPALATGAAGVHQGHRAAALSPVLSRDDDVRARLCRTGVLLGARLWADLPDARARPRVCGTLTLGVDAQTQSDMRAAVSRLQFPQDWVQWMAREDASRLAGLALPHGGLYFPEGRLVRPDALLPALTHAAAKLPARVAALHRTASGDWALCDATGTVLTHAPVVVLANAGGVPALLRAWDRTADPGAITLAARLPRLHRMQHLAGQISYFQATHDPLAPRCIVSGHGYWLPEDDGFSIAGSTHIAPAHALDDDTSAWDAQRWVSDAGHAAILEHVHTLCGVPHAALQARLSRTQAWSGWRAALADHLPVIGPVPAMDGVWTACAFGARGLCWAALAGEIIAAALSHAPMPLERELYRRIAPR